MTKIPSKSTFHAIWRGIDKRLLEQWIILQGKEINSRKEVKGLAVDSSGFKNRQASLWRFRKLHLIIALPSRAIVSLTHSHSNTHDSKVFGGLWQKLPSTLLKPNRRFYADSAYWTENIVGLIKQHGLHPVIRPKSNALIDNPLLGPIVRAHRFYPGLYNHNHHPEYRSSVEHVFGLIKLSFPPILDRLPSTILNTLYSPLICYNYRLLVQHS